MPGPRSEEESKRQETGWDARARSRGACHWFDAHRAKLNRDASSCDAQRSKSDVQRSMAYCVDPADLDIQDAVDQVQKSAIVLESRCNCGERGWLRAVALTQVRVAGLLRDFHLVRRPSSCSSAPVRPSLGLSLAHTGSLSRLVAAQTLAGRRSYIHDR
jgi:hypothetical protein